MSAAVHMVSVTSKHLHVETVIFDPRAASPARCKLSCSSVCYAFLWYSSESMTSDCSSCVSVLSLELCLKQGVYRGGANRGQAPAESWLACRVSTPSLTHYTILLATHMVGFTVWIMAPLILPPTLKNPTIALLPRLNRWSLQCVSLACLIF